MKIKILILIAICLSIVYGLTIMGTDIYYNVPFKGYNCDKFYKEQMGYKLTWLINHTKPYQVLYIKIETPEKNVWRLYNNEEIK